MDETLEKRIESLERAITDGEHDFEELATEAELADRVATIESEVESLTERVDELDAGTQALRGYVGNIRSVNNDVEQRADAALAKAESLETLLNGDAKNPTFEGNSAATKSTGVDKPRKTDSTSTPSPEDSSTPPESPKSAGGQTTSRSTPGSGKQHTNTQSQRSQQSPPTGTSDTNRQSTASSEKQHHNHHRCDACGRPEPNQMRQSPTEKRGPDSEPGSVSHRSGQSTPGKRDSGSTPDSEEGVRKKDNGDSVRKRGSRDGVGKIDGGDTPANSRSAADGGTPYASCESTADTTIPSTNGIEEESGGTLQRIRQML